MISLFQRKRPPPASGPLSSPTTTSKGLLQPETAATLLSPPRRQRLLEHIWQRTSLPRRHFATLYQAPIERYAELVQQFPASETHHHAYPGGMLDHGLEIVAYALKLRQSHLLPSGTSPEDQAAQAEIWTAAAAYGALLHDIGKIAVDLHVETQDGRTWRPWHGPLRQPYRFRHRKNRAYRLHNAATGLLYSGLLGSEILDWLSGYPEAWAALLYVLSGQYEHAGVLGELVVQADRASVAQQLGGDPARALAAPKQALQRKLLDGLRYLLKEELKLNQPQASDGWLTPDTLWLVSKTVSDKLRAHLLSQGIEGIPSNNTAVFNVLQDHGMLQPTPNGKAIWRATVTSETGWSHTFTLLRVAPALIWQEGGRPEPFAGTVTVEEDADDGADAPRPTTTADAAPADAGLTPPDKPVIENVDALLTLIGGLARNPTAEHAVDACVPPLTKESPAQHALSPPDSARATPECPSGEHFIAWLKQSILSRKLIINDAKALVHTVADTAFLVSPGLFQRYAQEHPQTAILARHEKVADWQWVQKRFEKLQLHRKQNNGLNIWTCEVAGPRKTRRLHGYLLHNPSRIFDHMPLNNPYLSPEIESGDPKTYGGLGIDKML